jgi:hypothetical protein
VAVGDWSLHAAREFVQGSEEAFISIFHFDPENFNWPVGEDKLLTGPKWNGDVLQINPITDSESVRRRIDAYKRAQVAFRDEKGLEAYVRLPIPVQAQLVRDALQLDPACPSRPGPVQRREDAAVARLSVGSKRAEPLAPRTPPGRGADPPAKVSVHSPALLSAMRRGAQGIQEARDQAALAHKLQTELHISRTAMEDTERDLRDRIARLMMEREVLLKHLEEVDDQRAADDVAMRALQNQLLRQTGRAPITYRRLCNDSRLRRVCADLTGFDTPEFFKAWFDVVCEKKGTEHEGSAARLKYWAGRDDMPMEVRQAVADYFGGDPAAAGTQHRLSSQRPAGLEPIDACLYTLYVLRTGIKARLAAAQFGISEGAASQIFTTWVVYMHRELEREHPWPTREEIARSRPTAFVKMGARDARMIIDCTEFVVEIGDEPVLKKLMWYAHSAESEPCTQSTALRTSSARSCWLRPVTRSPRSEYKQRYTVKLLVGMSPCGTIVYISEALPGSITDNSIVRVSRVMDFLEQGDGLLADRGFKIWSLALRNKVRLIIPACSFSQGKGKGTVPMTAQEAHNTYEIAHLRVHVERAMSEIKGGWRILHSPLIRARLRLVSAIVGICARMASYHAPMQPGTWVK